MPTITITVTDTAAARIQAYVDSENARLGTSFTVKQWLLWTVKETVISAELAAAEVTLKEQAESGAQTAFEQAAEAERQRLLAELD